MAGNAAEWVADRYARDAYMTMRTRNPEGPERGTARVYRGGSYLSRDAAEITTFRRQAADRHTSSGVDSRGRPFIGVRGAKSIDWMNGGNE